MQDVGTEELARFIFLLNSPGKAFSIASLEGVRSSRDLFTFLLDLLCRGIALLHGERNGSAFDLRVLSREAFDSVAARLACGGIVAHLASACLAPSDDEDEDDLACAGGATRQRGTRVNLPELLASVDPHAPLERFVLRVQVGDAEHRMWFSLRRPTR